PPRPQRRRAPRRRHQPHPPQPVRQQTVQGAPAPRRTPPCRDPVSGTAGALRPGPADDKKTEEKDPSKRLKFLHKQRCDVLRDVVRAREERFKAGVETIDAQAVSRSYLHRAELEVATTKAE